MKECQKVGEILNENFPLKNRGNIYHALPKHEIDLTKKARETICV